MYQIPSQYQFLYNIGTLPKLVSAGLQYYGIHEIKGTKNNPVIMDMAKGLGIDDIYTSDDQLSWCALFINHLIRITGKPLVDIENDKWNYLRAKWVLHWGNPVAKGQEKLGDILIFDRTGGGHVALYIAESGSTYYVLGGNQSNSVNITEIAKDRLIGVRNYYSINPPASAKKYFIDSLGNLSFNEK